MPLWLAIILAILILGFLVFVHELGHFWAARRNGVIVEKFALGFGPAIFKKKIGETEYALRIFPLGGYVKLLGEDSTDKSLTKNKGSLMAKTPWQRLQIIVAGVVMNLFVAWVLLTAGFALGLDPLITDFADLEQKLTVREYEHVPQIIVEKVKVGSSADLAGVKPQSILTAINGQDPEKFADFDQFAAKTLVHDFELKFLNSDETEVNVHLFAGKTLIEQGISLYQPAVLLKPQAVSVVENNALGIETGDIILSVNSVPQFAVDDFLLTAGDFGREVEVIRDGEIKSLKNAVVGNEANILVSEVLKGSPAENLGIKAGSNLISVGGQKVDSVEMAVNLLQSVDLPAILLFKNVDSGLTESFELKERLDNRVGLYLTESIKLNPLVSEFVMVPVLGSIVKNADYKSESRLLAPWLAVKESVHLTQITLKGLGTLVSNVFLHGRVPTEIGGPVAVATVTTQFLQYDLSSVIWLVAIISLSLAIMNILPIPALDGGRLLFIIVEVFRGGKPLQPKIEAVIHLFGFVLLLTLIVLVSFRDVANLFK